MPRCRADAAVGPAGPRHDAWHATASSIEIPLFRLGQGRRRDLFSDVSDMIHEWRAGGRGGFGDPHRSLILGQRQPRTSLAARPEAKVQNMFAGLRRGPVLYQTQPATGVETPMETTETNRGSVIPFLEGTDVFVTVQRPRDGDSILPNKLEADIFPHLVVAQNFADVVDIDEQQDRQRRKAIKEFAYSISGTPAVRIRMLRETSAPVRTPSYMPRVNVQLLWARGIKEALLNAGDIFTGLARLPRVGLWEAHLIVGHHSNGQDGCLTTTQERVPARTGPCQPDNVVPTAETINRIDGSFSTNYLRTGINYSRNWMPLASGRLALRDPSAVRDPKVMRDELQAVRELRVRGEFEYHPKAWVTDPIVDIYGRARLNLHGAYAARNLRGCPKRLEGSVGAVWNPGVVETVPSWSQMYQVSCFPALKGGWGIFARLYKGQDYYNVGFLDDITRFHVGATFNQSDFFRFRRRPTEAQR